MILNKIKELEKDMEKFKVEFLNSKKEYNKLENRLKAVMTEVKAHNDFINDLVYDWEHIEVKTPIVDNYFMDRFKYHEKELEQCINELDVIEAELKEYGETFRQIQLMDMKHERKLKKLNVLIANEKEKAGV